MVEPRNLALINNDPENIGSHQQNSSLSKVLFLTIRFGKNSKK